jgi:hypothetical protein
MRVSARRVKESGGTGMVVTCPDIVKYLLEGGIGAAE